MNIIFGHFLEKWHYFDTSKTLLCFRVRVEAEVSRRNFRLNVFSSNLLYMGNTKHILYTSSKRLKEESNSKPCDCESDV